MYRHIILYLQLFATITGWQGNMVETESPHIDIIHKFREVSYLERSDIRIA